MTSGKSHLVFMWMFDIYLAYLAVEMQADAILPLGPLDTGRDQWQSGDPDAALSGLYHSDGNPNMDISSCMGVVLLQLGVEETGQAIQSGLRLYAQQAFD